MGELITSENQDFMVGQIKNSIKIIETFPEGNELSFTALHNSLLSLVLLPFELVKKKDKQKIWQGGYSDVKRNIGFDEVVFSPIVECTNQNVKFNNKTQYSFIKKFRNAIAHQNIQIELQNCAVKRIIFFNIFPSKCAKCGNKECPARALKRVGSGIIDFKISFTYEQLHDFALYVANSYLRSITGEALEERKTDNGQG